MSRLELLCLCTCLIVPEACAGSSFQSGSTNSATGGTSQIDNAIGGTSDGGAPGTIGGATDSGGANATASGGTNATGGTGGVDYTSMTCNQLTTAYASELQKAKICSASLALAQCDKTVPNQPACGCSTFVVSTHVEAIRNLSSIANAYSTNNCAATCPQIACIATQSAVCQSAMVGSAAQCVDVPAATTN